MSRVLLVDYGGVLTLPLAAAFSAEVWAERWDAILTSPIHNVRALRAEDGTAR
jgi:hypothetical protein